MVILVPETTRLSIATGSFGIRMRNGLKSDTKSTPVIASITATGTATRRMRTMRLWRAAAAKRVSRLASKVWFWTKFTAAPGNEIGPDRRGARRSGSYYPARPYIAAGAGSGKKPAPHLMRRRPRFSDKIMPRQ
jgi:hypothetical protein